MKMINVTTLSLMAPMFAFAQYEPTAPYQQAGGPGMDPSYNQDYTPNQGAYQSGITTDSGAGLLVIGIIIYFLFFKKSGGASK